MGTCCRQKKTYSDNSPRNFNLRKYAFCTSPKDHSIVHSGGTPIGYPSMPSSYSHSTPQVTPKPAFPKLQFNINPVVRDEAPPGTLELVPPVPEFESWADKARVKAPTPSLPKPAAPVNSQMMSYSQKAFDTSSLRPPPSVAHVPPPVSVKSMTSVVTPVAPPTPAAAPVPAKTVEKTPEAPVDPPSEGQQQEAYLNDEPLLWYKPRSVDELHFMYSVKCESMALRLVRVFFLLVPAGMIVVGSLAIYKCKHIPTLPAWSISAGILWFIHCCFYFLFRKSTEKDSIGYRFIKGMFLFTAAGCFVMGTALTFGSVTTLELRDTSSNNYCDPILFFTSFSLVSIGYIFVAILIYFYTFTFSFSYYSQ